MKTTAKTAPPEPITAYRHDGSITQGGYSTHIVCREDFLIKIPDAFADLETEAAAAATPLLCAGITTYSPLKHWGAGQASA